MKANYHTHTERCRHAWGSDKAFVEAAIENGMKVLGFSDHCPWIFEDDYISGTRMLPSELDDYFSSITKLRDEYASDIRIYIGFEAEYIPELMENQNKLLADYPIDYMILGEHFTEAEPYSAYTGFPTDDESALANYVDKVIKGMETGKYKYVAHPDLFNFTGKSEIFKKHYMRLCRYLKSRDIPIEINLLGINEGRHYTSDRFLKIAAEAGNTAIIGCDAHTPESLSDETAHELCRRLADRHGLQLIDYLPGLGEAD